MKRLILRAVMFSLPFLVYGVFIFVVDPFSYVNSRSPVSASIRADTARQLNPCFWKMNQFNAAPEANILLGDSRMQLLGADEVGRVSGEKYFNFAYGGGTLREAIDTFWFAAGRTNLRKVYLGINLDTFNEANYSDRTTLFKSVKANPAFYFINKTVLQAALYDIYSQAAGKDLKLGAPNMNRDAFWKYELDEVMAKYFDRYAYPNKYLQDLAAISKYCTEHHIQLTFVIFPTSVDAQKLASFYKLDQAAGNMRNDLARLGDVYDFDYDNELTRSRENYSDPVHFTKPVELQLIEEIWGGRSVYARKVPRQSGW